MNNAYNKHTVSNARGKQISYKERTDPIQKLIKLLNQYHSIDLIENATADEKDWAKSRLYKTIMHTLNKCSSDIRGSIKASIKNKDIWEITRERLS